MAKEKLFTMKNIEKTVGKFTALCEAEHRLSSFDYCYNYFSTTDDLTKDMEKSCFELAFYLASWGMFRGSSFLLQKSAKYFEKTVKYINSLENDLWKIDVNNYDDATIAKLTEIYNKLNELTVEGESRPITLVTKIMLGVFGFVQAHDRYVCKTLKKLTNGKCSFTSFNEKSLKMIKKIYDDNKDSIDKISNATFTRDFVSGKETKIKYPKAKIIDMYCFMLSNKTKTAEHR